jgi:hypothetical protein
VLRVAAGFAFGFLALAGAAVASGCAAKHKKEPRLNAVIDVYRQNRTEAENCYRETLNQDPSVQGHVTVVWKVDHTGKALNARLAKSEVANSFLEECLLNHLKSLTFPAQPRFHPVEVEYEFDFQRQAKAPSP